MIIIIIAIIIVIIIMIVIINDSNNKFLIFLSGGGGKCSHQLRSSGFKIFVGKYNSFYADDLENMRKCP